MKISRRYGDSPADRACLTDSNCPDVLRLDDGRYLVIGAIARPQPEHLAEHGAGVGWGESAVVVPAEVMRAAAREIVGEFMPEPPGDDGGPSVRTCAADDQRWPLQKHGE